MIVKKTELQHKLGNVVIVTDDECNTTEYEYNAMSKVTKVINAVAGATRYTYSAAGDLLCETDPLSNTKTYTYDANGNVLTVVDSHGTITRTYDALNRVTSYTYDENNRVIGVTKPDGSVITTVYDNMQRVTSTVERTVSGDVITGFEYIYDYLSRIVEEKVLANSSKICYTYDVLGRVTSKTVRDLNTNAVISTENYCYDEAGNVVCAPDGSVVAAAYDSANRLVSAAYLSLHNI